MAVRRVSPNRMELLRLKHELEVARRGHRLLKDKRDGMMRRFLELVQVALQLRQLVDQQLAEATEAMALARAVLWPEVLGNAMRLAARPLEVEVSETAIMAVPVPQLRIDIAAIEDQRHTFPYGLASTTGEVDVAIDGLRKALPAMLELAEVEKTVQLLAVELERTRRRVNSLEHVMIPELEETIHAITLKMDENERDNLTRLMKVKDMIVADAIMKRRERDSRFAGESSRQGA